MKWITVNAGQKALVKKNERLVRILNEGKHWIGFGCIVELHSMNRAIQLTEEWDLLLEDEDLLQELNVTSINEDEIALEYKHDLFLQVILPGRVAYWKGAPYCVQVYNVNEMIDTSTISVTTLNKSAVLAHLKIYHVDYYQEGLLFEQGEYLKTLAPGQYYGWKAGKAMSMQLADLRTQTLEVNGQEILTKDKVGVRVNYSAQYKIMDVKQALIETKSYTEQMYTALQLRLRSYIGGQTLDQLLTNKSAIAEHVKQETAEVLKGMGVEYINGGIKDIILPGDIRDIMNQVLVAQKKAQANTIMRQEETASTRSLLNTAKLMENNAMLLKLKEMEYMEKIAQSIGEITVNGGSRVMDQLRDLVLTK